MLFSFNAVFNKSKKKYLAWSSLELLVKLLTVAATLRWWRSFTTAWSEAWSEEAESMSFCASIISSNKDSSIGESLRLALWVDDFWSDVVLLSWLWLFVLVVASADWWVFLICWFWFWFWFGSLLLLRWWLLVVVVDGVEPPRAGNELVLGDISDFFL